jgi:hypothetical protein
VIISSTYDEFGSIIHLFSNLPFHPCPDLPSQTRVPPVPVDEKMEQIQMIISSTYDEFGSTNTCFYTYLFICHPSFPPPLFLRGG